MATVKDEAFDRAQLGLRIHRRHHVVDREPAITRAVEQELEVGQQVELVRGHTEARSWQGQAALAVSRGMSPYGRRRS